MSAGLDTRLFDHLSVAIIVTDRDGLVTAWNRQAERVFGWSEAEALGQSVLDLLVSPDHLALAAEVMSRLSRGESWEGEFDVRRKDGETIHVYVADAPMLDATGEVTGFIRASIDLTETRREREELRRIQDLYRLVIENSQDLISISNVRGRVEFVSPSIRAVLGYDSDELVGKNFFDFIHPDDIERVRSVAAEAMAEGRGWVSSVRMRHKDGPWVELEGSGATIHDETGKPKYVLSTSRDVSASRRADEMVRYAAAS